jgi:hypothetical protein
LPDETVWYRDHRPRILRPRNPELRTDPEQKLMARCPVHSCGRSKPAIFVRFTPSSPRETPRTGRALCLSGAALAAVLLLIPARAWDSGLLSRAFRNEHDLMRHLETLARRPESRDWLKGRTEDWTNESLLVGRRAYHIPGSNSTL